MTPQPSFSIPSLTRAILCIILLIGVGVVLSAFLRANDEYEIVTNALVCVLGLAACLWVGMPVWCLLSEYDDLSLHLAQRTVPGVDSKVRP